MDTERNFANMDRTLHGGDGQALQHFMSNSPWSGQGVFSQIQAELKAIPALAHGSTLILDESADEKAGTHNAGASRQYKQQLENLRRNARRITPLYGPLIGLPMNNSASNFTGAAYLYDQAAEAPDVWPRAP